MAAPATAQAPPRRFYNGFVDGADLVLLYRGDNGQVMARRQPAEWSSFYKRQSVPADVLRDLRTSEYVAGIREEGEFVRVKWRAPEWRSRAHAPEGYVASLGIEALEADVSAERRYFSETGALVATPRRCYVDIETDSRVPPAIARRGKARVLCWTIVVDDEPERHFRDPKGLRVVATGVLSEDTDDAERKLLEDFWREAEAFDQLAAWFGDDFDFPILRTRAELLGAKTKDFRRWLFLDHLVGYERMNRNAAESGEEKESLALDNICRSLGIEGKTDFDSSKTYEAWAAGGAERRRLVLYMENDATRLPLIERKTGYLATSATLCEIARCFQTTANFFPIPIIDGFLLRYGVERGMRFPTKARDAVRGDQFAGAVCFGPNFSGIRKNVHALDFSGMYPGIMMTYNLSLETIANDVWVNGPIPPGRIRSPGTRVGTVVAPWGVIPELLRELKKLRKQWQKRQAELPPGTPEWYDAGRRSNAYKVAMNAIYGATGSPFCRFHDRRIAESTAQNGVWLIQKTVHASEGRGFVTEYGDTDSDYVSGVTRAQVAEFVAWCNGTLYPQLVAECGCVENFVEIAYEKEFERVSFITKKRYWGMLRHFKWTTTCDCENEYGDPGALDVRTMTCTDCKKHWDALPPPRGKPEIKGLEYKRGDANRLAKKLQYQVIEKMAVERCEDPAELAPLVEAMRDYVLTGSLPISEVQKSQAIQKALKEYKTKVKKDGTAQADPAHVQIAKQLKERGEIIEEGVKVAYFVVDGAKSPMKYAPAADYAGEFDRFYLWEDVIYPATQRVLEAAFPVESGMSLEQRQLRDWTRYAKVRPKPEKAAKVAEPGTRVPAAAPRKKKNEAQAALFAPAARVLAAVPDGPYEVEIAGESEQEVTRQLLKVKEVLRRHAGERDVVMVLSWGETTKRSKCAERVTFSSTLVRDVEAAKAAS